MKRFLPGFFLLLIVVGLGAFLGFRIWLQSYLKSDAARQRLSAAASAALGAQAEFTPLQPQSLEAIYADGFTARNGAAFSQLKADQLRADVRLGLFARSCVVENLDVTRLRLVLPGEQPRPDAVQTSAPTAPAGSGASASRFALRRVTVADFELEWGAGALEKTRLVMAPGQDDPAEWLLNGEGGTVRFAAGPPLEWRVDGFEARARRGAFYLTQARLRTEENGALTLEGEFGPGITQECRANFSSLPVRLLLPPDWRARLTGKLSGAVALNPSAPLTITRGEATLAEGELSALPLLDKVATLTHTDAFRRMRLHKGEAHFSGDPAGTVRVRDLVIESRGLLKIEGGFTLRDGRIDGTVQLGVIPSALEWVPGAREKVFTVARDGYLWTPVKLSGLAEHPTEDLTARLVTAAAEASVQAAGESVRKNAQGVIDLVKPLVPVKLPDLPNLLGP